jgi:hypothetical protein
MKKFFSIIALGAMTLSLSSFAQLASEVNCSTVAIDTYDAVFERSGGDYSLASAAADAAYDSCENQKATITEAP